MHGHAKRGIDLPLFRRQIVQYRKVSLRSRRSIRQPNQHNASNLQPGSMIAWSGVAATYRERTCLDERAVPIISERALSSGPVALVRPRRIARQGGERSQGRLARRALAQVFRSLARMSAVTAHLLLRWRGRLVARTASLSAVFSDGAAKSPDSPASASGSTRKPARAAPLTATAPVVAIWLRCRPTCHGRDRRRILTGPHRCTAVEIRRPACFWCGLGSGAWVSRCSVFAR